MRTQKSKPLYKKGIFEVGFSDNNRAAPFFLFSFFSVMPFEVNSKTKIHNKIFKIVVIIITGTEIRLSNHLRNVYYPNSFSKQFKRNYFYFISNEIITKSWWLKFSPFSLHFSNNIAKTVLKRPGIQSKFFIFQNKSPRKCQNLISKG